MLLKIVLLSVIVLQRNLAFGGRNFNSRVGSGHHRAASFRRQGSSSSSYSSNSFGNLGLKRMVNGIAPILHRSNNNALPGRGYNTHRNHQSVRPHLGNRQRLQNTLPDFTHSSQFPNGGDSFKTINRQSFSQYNRNSYLNSPVSVNFVNSLPTPLVNSISYNNPVPPINVITGIESPTLQINNNIPPIAYTFPSYPVEPTLIDISRPVGQSITSGRLVNSQSYYSDSDRYRPKCYVENQQITNDGREIIIITFYPLEDLNLPNDRYTYQRYLDAIRSYDHQREYPCDYFFPINR